ncbi:hypothetical protein CC78DRAFT_141378 [Lojkania enalia]|uniref:Uncharacterized protein n=1 Tax=Lojkania enalia TaxID=147567 RepID=A0A9P4NCK2_9PLEO|nr:hypothetical protein CC78DRAFT_141378 [Didymosphaeria enalia]
MDTAEGSTIRRTPPSFEWPYSSRRTLTLDSTSDSSPASSAFSHAPASRTSFVTSASAATGNSITLDEAKTTAQDPRGTPDKNEGAIFDGLPMQNPIDGAIEEKEKATHDWVLEYLRGGWLSNSPAKTTESTISPILPLAEDFSLVGNFRRPQRTASDEASAYSQDDIPPSIKGNSYFTKAGKHGRPIPTVTSRFKGKVGREMPHELVMGNSLASGPDHFKTPTSILSGATVFWTPDSGLGSLHSTVQPR